METLKSFWELHFSWLNLPRFSIQITDIVEIVILSIVIYHLLIWIRRTRTWLLLKGILFLTFFIALAYLFEMDTITFLIGKGIDVAMIAAVVVFQPELRRALEQLGEKKIMTAIMSFDSMRDVQERFSDKTIDELVKGNDGYGTGKDRSAHSDGEEYTADGVRAYRNYCGCYRKQPASY